MEVCLDHVYSEQGVDNSTKLTSCLHILLCLSSEFTAKTFTNALGKVRMGEGLTYFALCIHSNDRFRKEMNFP
jgi:hypothetical protein